LKPENVSLCLTEQEVLAIATKGQLTTHKNYDLAADLKKVAQDVEAKKEVPQSSQPTNKKAEARKRQRAKKKEKKQQ